MATAWGDGPYGLEGFGGVTSATVILTGVQSSGEVGTVSLSTINNFEVTGVEATGLIGEEFAFESATWGYNDWGGPPGWGGITSVSVELQGVVAFTELGSVSTRTVNNFEVTGVEATGLIGAEFVFESATWGYNDWGGPPGWGGITFATVNLVGVEASAELGVATTRTVNNFQVTGVEAVGEIGVATEITGGTNVLVSGVLGTTALGEEEVVADANVTVTGIQATAVLGTVDVDSKAVVNVTGVVGTIFEGETDESGKAFVVVTGVVGVGRVSRPLVWGLIDTSQNANWMPIAA